MSVFLSEYRRSRSFHCSRLWSLRSAVNVWRGKWQPHRTAEQQKERQP